MTLSDLASLAEVVVGIAVVVSLIYLAIQVRQNTHSIRSATLQANTAMWTSLLVDLSDPEAIEAYAAGLSGSRDISPMVYTRFFILCRGIFVAFEDQYFQYRNGILDADTCRGYERSISEQFLAFTGFRIWWLQSRHVFSPKFVEHMDEMIARTPVSAPDHFFREWQAFPRD